MKKILWIAVIVVLILVALGFLQKGTKNPATSSDTIKIGADLSLSGIASQDGESIKNGLELARAELKQKGIEVEVIYQDDKTEPKDTVSAIQALNTQNVQAIIGPTWSYIADAGVPVADQLKLVTIMPSNTSEYVSSKSVYAFFTSPRVERLAPTLTQWLKANGKKNIAVLQAQGAWYETVGKAVEKAVTDAGGKIVYTETVPYGTDATTISTVLAKVKASNPDIIFAEIDDDQALVALFKRINDLKITADVMSVTTAVGRVVSTEANNIRLTNKLHIVAPETSSAFETKYKEYYKTDATPYADRAYDSLMLLVDAIQNKGDLALHEYLRTKTNYTGLTGTYKFDANGDINDGEWVVKTIK